MSRTTARHPRVAVVTGSSSGMGLSIARRFVQEGWTVLGIDLQKPPAGGVSDGAVWTTATIDIRSRKAVAEAIGNFLATLPERRIDAVINVAGVYPPTTIEDFTLDSYRLIFDVNVLGTANVAAECLPAMGAGSAIVNFASADAFTVSRGQLLYGASKAAVVMLTKGLALEVAHRDIRVNAIAPGWVATPGNAATGRMDAAAAGIPLGRVAQPEEIAEWAWLISGGGKATFMTGETLLLTGGDVLR